MKRLIIAIAMMLCAAVGYAQDQNDMQNIQTVAPAVTVNVDDYQIVSDEVKDGVRYIVAVPSAKVCSNKIEIEIVDGIIMKVAYTRGCDGNAKGIGALIKGMSVDEAIRRLEGITCGKKPTSCPDQLARILKSLK